MIGDLERQRSFIAASMECRNPKYRYTRQEKQRNFNQSFFFSLQEKKIRVCKLFLKNTPVICDRPIRTVIEKKENNFLQTDNRGKHLNHYKVDADIKDSVREHINSIPRTEIHYLRANTSREFIDGGKSLADLHRDYQRVREEKQLPFANLMMYSHIFNGEFNISFFHQRKTYAICTSHLRIHQMMRI